MIHRVVRLLAIGLIVCCIPPNSGGAAAADTKERIAIVDFDVQGDVGIADAGKIVPRLLLSEFAEKYEMVTRTQLQALLTEKNLQVSDLMDADKAKQYGKLIPVKYLVVGEVMKGAEYWMTAQLVEVGPGIIRSPRKVSASTYQELEKKIPLLGKLLLMDDERYKNWQDATGNTEKRALLGDLIVQYPKILEFNSGDFAYASYHGGIVVRNNRTGAEEIIWAGEPGHPVSGDFKKNLDDSADLRMRMGSALSDEVSIFNDALRVQVFQGGGMIFETRTAITWRSVHEMRRLRR
ncbi:MAG: CsgG/HfaB family protein [Planctomycetota bacterium]